ncbi:MAG: carbonic anhydrase [Calditrichaeota bacterium]|nr:carbonic anhydrase [Calditrichota bacterium]
MDQLISIDSPNDILEQYRNTPVGLLLEYHNLNRDYDDYTTAQLLIGMCMDNRKHLHIPDNFAFIIRAGGANLRYSEFKVSYAIAFGGITHIALIGHNNCGMADLKSKKEDIINGLIERAGWKREAAEAHYAHYAPLHEIGNEIQFILSETKRLREQYPKIVVAPMLYSVDNNRIYLIREE